MKTLVTFFAIFLLSTGLFAQKFIQEWWRPLPNIPAYAEAKAIMTTNDNQLFIAGPTHENWENGNMFYSKTDTAGNLIWLTYADEQFESYYQCPYHLMTDIENNLIMIGTYPVVYNQVTYFTKLSPSGEILKATINGTQYGYQGGYDVEQTADRGFLVAAESRFYYSGQCLALRKLDNEGNFIWDTTFVDADTNFIKGIFYGMDKVDDSTFVLTGKKIYKTTGADETDILFAKVRVYDDSVQLMNLTIYEGEYNDVGFDILTLPNNQGYIICGTGPNEKDPQHGTEGILLRVDTAGNMLWRKTYSRSLMSQNKFIKVHLDTNNDILVLAQTNGGSLDPSLLKYSLDGELLQKKHFDQGTNEPVYDFAVDHDGKIYILAVSSHDNQGWASVLKVKDICPVNNPEAAPENNQPVLGEDLVVHVEETHDVWQYSLVLLKDSTVLGTHMGNNGILDFTASGLNNEDVSEGIVVSVIEPNVDCYKNSDTLYPEFICPVVKPEVSLVNATPNYGEDIVVQVANTNDAWKYNLIQVNGEITLVSTTGNGSTLELAVSELTNEDVSEGLIVSVMLPGFDECKEISDTLFPQFIDGVEDLYQTSLQIIPNPTHDYITVSDAEHQLSSLEIYSLSGKLLLKENILSKNSKINLSNFSNGIYLFKITYQEGVTAYQKVIKN